MCVCVCMFCCCCFFPTSSFSFYIFLICALLSHNERSFIFREFARFYRICFWNFLYFQCSEKRLFLLSQSHWNKNTDKGCCISHTCRASLIYFQHTNSEKFRLQPMPGTLACDFHENVALEQRRRRQLVRSLHPFSLDWFIFLLQQRKKSATIFGKVACFEMLGTHFLVDFSNVNNIVANEFSSTTTNSKKIIGYMQRTTWHFVQWISAISSSHSLTVIFPLWVVSDWQAIRQSPWIWLWNELTSNR